MTAVGVAALMWQPSSAQRYALESCFTCFEALGSGRRDGLQLQAEHLADLRGSGLTDETIAPDSPIGSIASRSSILQRVERHSEVPPTLARLDVGQFRREPA